MYKGTRAGDSLYVEKIIYTNKVSWVLKHVSGIYYPHPSELAFSFYCKMHYGFGVLMEKMTLLWWE